MHSKIYFAMLLILGLTVPKIYCAEQPQVNSGRELLESIEQHDYVKAKNLIRAGADVNYRFPANGRTSLMLAVGTGDDLELIQMLVDHHADVNAATITGVSALHNLAYTFNANINFAAIANILLLAGANINARNNGGETPLHVAAWRGFDDWVQYLLSKGANPNIKNDKGKRPVDLVPANDVQLRQMLLLTPHRSHYKK